MFSNEQMVVSYSHIKGMEDGRTEVTPIKKVSPLFENKKQLT